MLSGCSLGHDEKRRLRNRPRASSQAPAGRLRDSSFSSGGLSRVSNGSEAASWLATLLRIWQNITSRIEPQRILAGVYETGKKYAASFLENMPILFDEHQPRWNYRAIPQQA